MSALRPSAPSMECPNASGAAPPFCASDTQAEQVRRADRQDNDTPCRRRLKLVHVRRVKSGPPGGASRGLWSLGAGAAGSRADGAGRRVDPRSDLRLRVPGRRRRGRTRLPTEDSALSAESPSRASASSRARAQPPGRDLTDQPSGWREALLRASVQPAPGATTSPGRHRPGDRSRRCGEATVRGG